jgi:hypothetical protein
LEKRSKESKTWCEIVPAECDKKCLKTGICSRKGETPKKKDKDENQY